jgi:hypothetical protein
MRRIAYCILAILMAVGTLTASAQSEDTRNVSGYIGVASSGPFDVHIKIDGTETLKIVAKSEAMAKIETKVEDGKLQIRWKDHWNWKWNSSGNYGKIDIYVTARSLTEVSNGGSGVMAIDGMISGSDVNVSMSGSGSITGAVKADELHSSMSGSGSIHLTGSADKADLNISGSGSFHSKELQINTANIRIAGSGNAHITAEKTISAHIAGSGEIFYSGNAKEGDVKVFGSGDIRKE